MPPRGVVTRVADPQLRDAGRRAADIINAKYAVYDWSDLQNQYMAIRISDGGSDGVLYETFRDAVRHQINEQQCYYVCFRNLGPAGAVAREMSILLDFARKAYAAGIKFVDPDAQMGGAQAIMTAARHDAHAPNVLARICDLDSAEAELAQFRRELGLY